LKDGSCRENILVVEPDNDAQIQNSTRKNSQVSSMLIDPIRSYKILPAFSVGVIFTASAACVSDKYIDKSNLRGYGK
jgi:hypothetical protein